MIIQNKRNRKKM